MEKGAVVVAAGMSSRMGAFKPMMPVGSISVAQRIIATLQQAGCTLIVVVTGNQADQLERHLAGSSVVFLRNEKFEQSDMYRSAQIGLAYMQDKCDQVLFTPVDVPLFSVTTARALFDSKAMLALPVHGGQEGHPIMMKRNAIGKIISYHGGGGLRKAIEQSNLFLEYLEVQDEGVLYDVDTPRDFNALLHFHNSQMLRPIVEISFAKEEVFFDLRCAQFLRLIKETGSVKTACRRSGLSYSKAWRMIKLLERNLNISIVERQQGGLDGGSSYLTEKGEEFLEKYLKFENALRKFTEDMFLEYFPALQKIT